MKKTYEAPEIQIIRFVTEDILDGSVIRPGSGSSPQVGPVIPLFGNRN